MTEPTDATSTLLVDWATRIEVEFLSFKQTINDALSGVPDEESQPKAKSIKSLEGKLDTLVSSVKSLIKQVNNLERLKPRCGNVCADNVSRVSTLDSQLFSLKCEIGNLRDLQDQLIKNHHVQAVLTEDKRRYEGTRVTDDRLRTDVSDIKYFLKLLLPKVVAMQADSHKIKAQNAQLVQLLGRVGDAAIPSQDHESYSDRELSIRRRRPRVLLPAEDDSQHPKKSGICNNFSMHSADAGDCRFFSKAFWNKCWATFVVYGNSSATARCQSACGSSRTVFVRRMTHSRQKADIYL